MKKLYFGRPVAVEQQAINTAIPRFRWLLFVLAINSAIAGSATWELNPSSNDWNTAANWIPDTVPNGPADTATFDVSNTTAISLSARDTTEVDGIVFNPDASAFTITINSIAELVVSGVGITNNSGITQNFVMTARRLGPRGKITFQNGATAGTGTVYTHNGGGAQFGFGGTTEFLDNFQRGKWHFHH